MVAVLGFELDLAYVVYVILIGLNAGIGYRLLKVQERYYNNRMELEDGRRTDARVYYEQRLMIERDKVAAEHRKIELEEKKLELRKPQVPQRP